MKTFIIHLYGLAICSFVMGFIFLGGHKDAAVPVAVAFSTIGMLSGFCAAGLRHVNKRLDEINKPASNPTELDLKKLF